MIQQGTLLYLILERFCAELRPIQAEHECLITSSHKLSPGRLSAYLFEAALQLTVVPSVLIEPLQLVQAALQLYQVLLSLLPPCLSLPQSLSHLNALSSPFVSLRLQLQLGLNTLTVLPAPPQQLLTALLVGLTIITCTYNAFSVQS